MALKSMVVFGTFDQNLSAWPTQSSVFASVIQSVLRSLSRVNDLTATQVGALRTRGGLPIVSRAQVRIPTSGDAATDLIRGSKVGMATDSPQFRISVDRGLRDNSGFASALIDLETSLDKAIQQSPPGLIVSGGSPSVFLTERVSPFPSARIWSVITAGIVANAATITQALLADPGTLTFMGTTYKTLGLFLFAANNGLTALQDPLIGGFTFRDDPVLVVGGTPVNYRHRDTKPATVELLKNAAPVGTVDEPYGPPTNPIRMDLEMLAVIRSSSVDVTLNGLITDDSISGKFTSKSLFETLAGVTTATTPYAAALEFTNDTGVDIAAGSHICDLVVNSGGSITE